MLFSFKFNQFTVARTTVRAQMRLELRITPLFRFYLFLKYWRITSNIKTWIMSLCLRIEPALRVEFTLRDTSLLKHITASVLLDTELKHPVSSEMTAHIKLQTVQRFNSIWYCSETSGSFREADSCDSCSNICRFHSNKVNIFINSKRYCFEKETRDFWLKANKLISLVSKY